MTTFVASSLVYLLTFRSVIAVHGIGANADLTWESRGVNWLKHDDMLPSAAKTARIMRFSYNSQWLGQNSIVQHLSAIANDLLYSIRNMRQVRDCATVIRPATHTLL